MLSFPVKTRTLNDNFIDTQLMLFTLGYNVLFNRESEELYHRTMCR